MPCARPRPGGAGRLAPQVTARAGPGGAELNGTFLPPADEPGWAPAPASDDLVLQTLPARAAGRPRLVPGGHPGIGSGGRSAPELILDDSNLLPFDFLRNGDRLGRAVVKLERADGTSGTAFLVAPGVLLTNHHVLPDPTIAAAARVLANHEATPADDPAGRPVVVPLRPEALFLTHEDLDFSFCGVAGLDHLGAIPLGRDSLDVVRSEYVNIIQHPRGRPKEVALQDNQVVKVDPVVLHYSCDTEPGSSGSPVFNNRWELVALHHASVAAAARAGGRRAAGTDGRGRFLNEGIRLSAIALWLESAEAEAPALRAASARVRALFEGHDPQAGYFGALGRRSSGRTAARFVRECYRGSDGVLDVAAWDLSGATAADRDELGWALAALAADLVFLPGLPGDEAAALADHLESHHRLDYEPLRHGPEAVPLLARRGRWEWSSAPAGARSSAATVVARSRAHPGRGARLLLIAGADPDPHPDPDHGPGLDPDLPTLGLAIGAGPPPGPGPDAARLAEAPEGRLWLAGGPAGGLTRVYVSPNLARADGDGSGTGAGPIVSAGRAPAGAPAVALMGRAPLAARLVFGRPTGSPARESSARAEPGSGAEASPSDLERAVSRVLAPLVERLARGPTCGHCQGGAGSGPTGPG